MKPRFFFVPTLVLALMMAIFLVYAPPSKAYKVILGQDKFTCDTLLVEFPQADWTKAEITAQNCVKDAGTQPPTPPPVEPPTPGAPVDPGSGVWHPYPNVVVGDYPNSTNRLYWPGCLATPDKQPASLCKNLNSLVSGWSYVMRVKYTGNTGNIAVRPAESGETYSGGYSLDIGTKPGEHPSPKPNCRVEATYPGIAWVDYDYYQAYLAREKDKPYFYDIYKYDCKLKKDKLWYMTLRRKVGDGKIARVQINRVGM